MVLGLNNSTCNVIYGLWRIRLLVIGLYNKIMVETLLLEDTEGLGPTDPRSADLHFPLTVLHIVQRIYLSNGISLCFRKMG